MQTTTSNEILTDNSPMPFGKHRGKAMVDVPAVYLLWLYNNPSFEDGPVKKYILNNLDVINKEASKVKR